MRHHYSMDQRARNRWKQTRRQHRSRNASRGDAPMVGADAWRTASIILFQ